MTSLAELTADLRDAFQAFDDAWTLHTDDIYEKADAWWRAREALREFLLQDA